MPKQTKNEEDIKVAAQDLLDFGDNLNLLQGLKEEVKSLAEKATELSDKGKRTVALLGNRNPKGHSFITTDKWVATNEERKRITPNEEKLRKLCKAKGVYKKVFKEEVVEVIDEEALAVLVEVGSISIKELDAAMDTNVSVAFMVRPVKKTFDPSKLGEDDAN